MCGANNEDRAVFNSTHVAIDGGDDGIPLAVDESLVLFCGGSGTNSGLLAVCTANAIVEGKLYPGSTEYL